jgi:hypothetical protein
VPVGLLGRDPVYGTALFVEGGLIPMGEGDKRTRRGKIFEGS